MIEERVGVVRLENISYSKDWYKKIDKKFKLEKINKMAISNN